ncbi:type VI secretion system baseplate subunit TssK [Limnobacter alexandrii]|uniref:type VI secretion system baseplate subunit TssK n=1 Tax=Limnobacter alexandrii TaxID=2570352 RepID=UPI0011092AF3|nr:type VI secretion system baseplate subunit TssK [Limnobacter alexandrii]
MTKNNRVIWSEGLFLQPQHFQQQERHFEHEVHIRTSHFNSYCHGFHELKLDQDLLLAGKISILKASGYFPDGSYFSIPDQDPAPPCLDLSSEGKDSKIFLALARPHWQAQHLGWGAENEEGTIPQGMRYRGQRTEIPSIYDQGLEAQSIELGQLNTFISTGHQTRDGVVCLQICELRESRQGLAQIDETFIEPCLCSIQNNNIRRMLEAVLGLLQSKIDQLRQRRVRKGSHNSSEIGDFLLLKSCIEHRLLILHSLALPKLHPETAYIRLLECLGSVTLYGNDTAADFIPNYDHDNLRATFSPLLAAIRNALAGLHDQHAIQIPLTQKQSGVHLAQINDRTLLTDAHFYLTVHALAPEELVQRQFPSTVKIGPVEKLRDLVNLNLPGVRLKPTQHNPPALPYYADHLYFQLETRTEVLWKMLEQTGQLAIHYAGDLPELRMELWAVRREQEHLL